MFHHEDKNKFRKILKVYFAFKDKFFIVISGPTTLIDNKFIYFKSLLMR